MPCLSLINVYCLCLCPCPCRKMANIHYAGDIEEALEHLEEALTQCKNHGAFVVTRYPVNKTFLREVR